MSTGRRSRRASSRGVGAPETLDLIRLDLAVDGMTCAACVGRVERSLNRLDGVFATVNLATERAQVDFDPGSVSAADLVGAVEKAGYPARIPDPAADDDTRAPLVSLERRLAIATALGALPVLGLLPGMRSRRWQLLYLAAATPVATWAAAPFHRRALAGIRRGHTSMDTLVSIGTTATFVMGAGAVLRGRPGHRDLGAATGIVGSMLSGRVMEARGRGEASAAVRSLITAGARQATVLAADGTERAVAAADLRVGQRFVVRPGERVATDGVVEEGEGAVDQSLLTGESVPVDVAPGSSVAGGSINASARLVVRATRVGSATALAGIARLVADAQTGKAPVQHAADRIASVFVPAVLGLAGLTFASHRRRGRTTEEALRPTLSVLVAACPCALGLATPAALMVGIGRGAELGIFIRSPGVLEATRQADVVLLDKTGTVTTGEMRLADHVAAEDVEPAQLLRVAAALEFPSEHPVGRAVVAGAVALETTVEPVQGFQALPGSGVTGVVGDLDAIAGRPALLAARGLLLSPELAEAIVAVEARGEVAVAVGWEGRVRGLLAVTDTIRPTSAAAVEGFSRLGLRTVLVTGDHEAAARAVADQVGIREVIAGVLPGEKVDVVDRLRAEGAVVAMVGDGLNDAPALARAELGIAMGTGTDVAMQAADLTLATSDLLGAVDAVRLSRATLRTIHMNVAWAGAYNLLVLPVAAAGRLNPWLASASMALSSVVVLGNSLRLRQFTPGG